MWTAIAVAILSALSSSADAAKREHAGIAVDVIGEGRPVLMIPGLNSAAAVWRETCDALRSEPVQCHIVQLPGFAGQPAIDTAAFLPGMRDRLLDYLQAQQLEHVVVIGHSLGGVLALELAMQQPDVIERIVVVDALPFLPAAQDPAATSDSVRPFADRLRTQLQASDAATYRVQSHAALQGMTNRPERIPTLRAWGDASDRATTAQAMYEIMTTDLRGELPRITTPTLVLGAWAGYAAMGANRTAVAATFAGQYAGLDGVRIELSDAGYHFLMWDDPEWLQQQVREFIARPEVAAR